MLDEKVVLMVEIKFKILGVGGKVAWLRFYEKENQFLIETELCLFFVHTLLQLFSFSSDAADRWMMMMASQIDDGMVFSRERHDRIPMLSILIILTPFR